MIISHQYKFIFIKTRKTAGTSIEAFLSQVCAAEDVFTPVHPPLFGHQSRNYRGLFNPLAEFRVDRGMLAWARTTKHLALRERFYNHMPARLVQLRLPPDVFNDYFKFCVERNPWDKALSYYHMANHKAGGKLSLQKFVKRRQFSVDYPLYTDAQGRLLVDHVVRFENLTTQLGEVFVQLGIPFSGSLGVKAKGEYRQDRRPYQEVFTAEHRDIIARAYASEIAMFNYQF